MDLEFVLRAPESINPDTRVLVLLHGYGSNEQDLFAFTPTLPADWFIISFRGPLITQWGGFSWYEIDFNNPEKFIDVAQATSSLNAILNSILTIRKEYNLQNETHLCGFSQGGILSYALALKNPQMFGKVALLSCYPEEKILTDIVKDKKKLQHLQFFISHGTDDAVIPIEWARKGAELLYDLGCFFSFREYVNGHGINQKNYMDLMDFLSK